MNSTNGRHPAPDELSAWLDGSLSETDRTRIDAHVARCDDCRDDVVEVMRLFRPDVRRRAWPVAAGIAAAALAAILVFAPWEPSGPTGPVFRGPDAAVPDERAPAPGIVHPADESTTDLRGVHFGWRAAAPEATYRLTLTDDTGNVVWTASTTDTLLTLPPDSALDPAATYFWYVDALLPDGRSVSSGVHEFRTSR